MKLLDHEYNVQPGNTLIKDGNFPSGNWRDYKEKVMSVSMRDSNNNALVLTLSDMQTIIITSNDEIAKQELFSAMQVIQNTMLGKTLSEVMEHEFDFVYRNV